MERDALQGPAIPGSLQPAASGSTAPLGIGAWHCAIHSYRYLIVHAKPYLAGCCGTDRLPRPWEPANSAPLRKGRPRWGARAR